MQEKTIESFLYKKAANKADDYFYTNSKIRSTSAFGFRMIASGAFCHAMIPSAHMVLIMLFCFYTALVAFVSLRLAATRLTLFFWFFHTISLWVDTYFLTFRNECFIVSFFIQTKNPPRKAVFGILLQERKLAHSETHGFPTIRHVSDLPSSTGNQSGFPTPSLCNSGLHHKTKCTQKEGALVICCGRRNEFTPPDSWYWRLCGDLSG